MSSSSSICETSNIFYSPVLSLPATPDLFASFHQVNILMNNAAIGEGGGTYAGNLDKWRNLLDVNLFGVINGVQTFAPFMEKQKNSSVIINTGESTVPCPSA